MVENGQLFLPGASQLINIEKITKREIITRQPPQSEPSQARSTNGC